jgi:hypothetical protein
MRPSWSENLSTSALDEIIKAQDENKLWYKRLRLCINTLMDSKLAKHIGTEEYKMSRQAANEEMTECSRRARLLREEIAGRRVNRVRPGATAPPDAGGARGLL